MKDKWDKTDIILKAIIPLSIATLGGLGSILALNFEQKKYEEIQIQSDKDLKHRYLNTFLSNIDQPKKDKFAVKLLSKIDPPLANEFIKILKTQEPTNKNLNSLQDSILLFGTLNQYKIGIYFLPKMEDEAKIIKQKLISLGFKGTVAINSRDNGFFTKIGVPQGNEVRYEPNIEKPESDILLKVLEESFPDKKFVKRAVKNRTPNFLSIMLK